MLTGKVEPAANWLCLTPSASISIVMSVAVSSEIVFISFCLLGKPKSLLGDCHIFGVETSKTMPDFSTCPNTKRPSRFTQTNNLFSYVPLMFCMLRISTPRKMFIVPEFKSHSSSALFTKSSFSHIIFLSSLNSTLHAR